jgi:hypothetical protein
MVSRRGRVVRAMRLGTSRKAFNPRVYGQLERMACVTCVSRDYSVGVWGKVEERKCQLNGAERA